MTAMDVLVVDDDLDVRTVLELGLSASGHRVRTAATAEEALLASAERRPDVLLVDVGLPGLHGDDLVSWLDRGLGRPRRICLVSGQDAAHLRATASRMGVEYLAKPFGIDEVLDLVDTAPVG